MDGDLNNLGVGDELLSDKSELVEVVDMEYMYDSTGVAVRTLCVDTMHNYFVGDGINYVLVHNKGFQIHIQPARGGKFTMNLEHNFVNIATLKYMIQQTKNIHVQHQTLMFSGITLKDDKTLYEYNIHGSVTLQLLVKSEDSEMGLAAGGKMKQKIYSDSQGNLNRYNIKKVTRVICNI
eukprot:UN07642